MKYFSSKLWKTINQSFLDRLNYRTRPYFRMSSSLSGFVFFHKQEIRTYNPLSLCLIICISISLIIRTVYLSSNSHLHIQISSMSSLHEIKFGFFFNTKFCGITCQKILRVSSSGTKNDKINQIIASAWNLYIKEI